MIKSTNYVNRNVKRDDRMAQKVAAFRRPKKKGHLGVLLVLITLVVFVGLFGYNSLALREQEKELDNQIAAMTEKMTQEEERTRDLQEFETYTHTKKYAEEVAKEKLGYVYEGEIVFKKDE